MFTKLGLQVSFPVGKSNVLKEVLLFLLFDFRCDEINVIMLSVVMMIVAVVAQR